MINFYEKTTEQKSALPVITLTEDEAGDSSNWDSQDEQSLPDDPPEFKIV